MELDRDENGMIVMCPLLGWTLVPTMEVALLLRLQYATTPEEVGTAGQSLQVVLSAQDALALAASMTRQAQYLLSQPPPSQARN